MGQTLDDELAHAGPTGFARQLLAIRGRSGQNKKNVFDFKASQIEPPIQIYKGADDSHPALLQAVSRNVDGTFKAVERRHLTVEMADGSRQVLPFPIGWGPDQLRSATEKRGLLVSRNGGS